MMRKYLLHPGFIIVIAFTALQGCFGPRKMDKWVTEQYGEAINTPPKKTPDYLTITGDSSFAANQMTIGTRKTSHVLPLLFYWQWDDKTTCALNPKIPLNNITNAITSYAAKKGLKQKLGTQRIELHIDKMPNTFAVDNKGHLVWLILYSYSWNFISVQPEKQDLVVSYHIYQGSTEVKSGAITTPDLNKKLPLAMFHSLKKRVWNYLDDYDANMATMARTVVDNLVAEL